MKGRTFLFLQSGARIYRCQFTKDMTMIGRDQSNDIVIRDASVSEMHAQITCADGVYTVRGIDDSEVFVDGERISQHAELINGNKIEIGDMQLLFACERYEAPNSVHLIVRRPNQPPTGFWTSKNTIVIGSERGDLILTDPGVSNVHAVIENFCKDGQFVLDARSQTGTLLNGEKIKARCRLQNGDVITVGNVEIECYCDVSADQTSKNPTILAAEQLMALRALDRKDSAAGSDIPLRLQNPYQRDPTAPKDNESLAQPGAQLAPQERRRRSRHRRRGSMDLTSGLQTGIVAVSRRPTSNTDDSVVNRQRSASAPLPSKAVPARPEPTYQPTDAMVSSQRAPRAPANRAGFGERRDEMDTRLTLGSVNESGLWYLPRDKAENSEKGSPLAKPIIRVRGDEVPSPERVDDGDSTTSNKSRKQKAKIRRPSLDSNELKPMVPAAGRIPTVPGEPTRYRPEVRSTSMGSERDGIRADREPGARPGAQERWYTPGKKVKPMRQRQMGSSDAWYLPDQDANSGKSGDGSEEFGDIDKGGKASGRTQVIDDD